MDLEIPDLDEVAGVAWSVCVRDVTDGGVTAQHDADAVLPIASVGKLLLLIETARRLDERHLDGSLQLARQPDDEVADSGLWQHLSVAALTVDDLAVLIGSVSDNLATNVLLRHVGLDAVGRLGDDLGLVSTRLLDRVRDVRTDADPVTMARGSADELSGLLLGLAQGTVVSPGASARVRGWLAHGADLSLVAAPFGLDPLARGETAHRLTLLNKTGADPGIRADVGVVTRAGRGLAYAALGTWAPGRQEGRAAIVEGMHGLGRALRDALS